MRIRAVCFSNTKICQLWPKILYIFKVTGEASAFENLIVVFGLHWFGKLCEKEQL